MEKGTRKDLCILIVASLVLSVIFLMVNANPFNTDTLLAWPIAESIINPNLYSKFDLVVTAGKETNFLLYKVLTHFPWWKDNLPIRDTVIYFPIFIAFTFFWGLFFFRTSKNLILAVFTLVLFLFSDNKLGLHWSFTPVPFLVSITSVNFLQILALLFCYEKKYKLSLSLLGLTSFFHPASSLSYFITFSLVGLLREKNLKQMIVNSIFFIIAFGTNYFLFIKGSSSVAFTPEHWRIYDLFQYHVFIGDHFNEGYLYFFSMLGLLYSLRANLPNEFLKFSNFFLGISMSLCCLWLLNIYSIRNLQFTYFYYPMRIFYLVKPFLLFAVTWGLSEFLKQYEPQITSILKKFLLFIFVFGFSKCLFKYPSFSSSLLVLSLISIVSLRSFFLSSIFSVLFLLSSRFKWDSLIYSSGLHYWLLPFVIFIIYLICSKKVRVNEV